MPADLRGSYYRTKTKGHGVRWRESDGARVRQSGFETKREAREWWHDNVRPRLLGIKPKREDVTLTAFVELYLARLAATCESSTIGTLCGRLKHAEAAFGTWTLAELEAQPAEIAEWTRTLSEGSRYGIVQALRQTLEAAVRWNLIDRNPAKLAGANPQPKRTEIVPFAHEEIEKLAVELGPWGPLVIFASETGLRPGEWIALEHADIMREERAFVVERTFSHGRLRKYGKTARSRRRVPLSSTALSALDAIPRRLNSRLVFPARGGGGGVKAGHGGYLDLHNFRARDWTDALDAAGIPPRRIYDLRHTFATNALRAGINIFELARYMGTSVEMIDRTYGHLARGSEVEAGERLDDLAARTKTNSRRLAHDWPTA